MNREITGAELWATELPAVEPTTQDLLDLERLELVGDRRLWELTQARIERRDREIAEYVAPVVAITRRSVRSGPVEGVRAA